METVPLVSSIANRTFERSEMPIARTQAHSSSTVMRAFLTLFNRSLPLNIRYDGEPSSIFLKKGIYMVRNGRAISRIRIAVMDIRACLTVKSRFVMGAEAISDTRKAEMSSEICI
jgi:hypothetical protein